MSKLSFWNKITAGFEISFDDFHENCTSGLSAPWVIRRRDIHLIAHFFNITDCYQVLDAGCGYGFISWLIAMEGVPVTGLDIDERIEHSPFQHSLLSLVRGDLHNPPQSAACEGLFMSWAGQGHNLAPAIISLDPQAVVYVVETTGLTGDSRCIPELIPSYSPFVYWDNVSYMDINSQLHTLVTGGAEGSAIPDAFKTSHNRVILFTRRDLEKDKLWQKFIAAVKKPVKPYVWESELDRYYRVRERLEGGRKILWQPKRIIDEMDFLKDMELSGIAEKGLIF